MNYYNDNEPYVCEWLKNLIREGHLPPGDVDGRDIREIAPGDLDGYTQCHFFAGIGGWPLALQMSGYEGLVCWTGSCPCQPFSAAGKGQASGDERHLWPEWFRLIQAVRPPVIFGEQVEAAIGWGWLDLVHTGMEQEGYTIRSTVLPACGVGAPHIRQRLWFVADYTGERRREERQNGRGVIAGNRSQGIAAGSEPSSNIGELADTNSARCGEQRSGGIFDGEWSPQWDNANGCGSSELADTQPQHNGSGASGPGRWSEPSNGGHWSNLQWLPCTDGKQRPTGVVAHSRLQQSQGRDEETKDHNRSGQERSEQGGELAPRDGEQGPTQSIIQPLAHGVPARVGKLRAAGNAIVPQVAAEFIKAVMNA